jgi:short-subunit dehydrogenase
MARVLILGANSAIARELAVRCKARGDSLYLVARDAQKLAALKNELGEAVAGSQVADLAETDRNGARVEEAIARLGGLDLVLLAHGYLGDQLESERSWAAAEEVLATNFLSAVSLLIPIANQLEAQRGGKLVVLGSVAGDRGRPRNYTYGAAKGALHTYLQGLRSRLYGTGVKVFTIHLGPVHSPMTVDHPKNRLFADPGPIADALLKISEGRREDVWLPWYWAPIMTVVRNLPEPIFQRLKFLSGR